MRTRTTLTDWNLITRPFWLRVVGWTLLILGAIGLAAFRPGAVNEPWFLVPLGAGLIVAVPRRAVVIALIAVSALFVTGSTLKSFWPVHEQYGLIETHERELRIRPDGADRLLQIRLDDWNAETIEEAEENATAWLYGLRWDVFWARSVVAGWSVMMAVVGVAMGYLMLHHRRAWDEAPSKPAGMVAVVLGLFMVAFYLAPGVWEAVETISGWPVFEG